ncbi:MULTISPECIES: hypothetical protein [unclassified Streptomyces]|uniref:hypothetical protein n=1 Tax=unclassified Streptomyces TaxID=2593676 RepID=UPI003D74816C
MPYAPPPRSPSGPRRRSLLASAAGAALLAGCSPGSDGSASGESPTRPSAADQARARAARDSAGLVERYDAVLAAHPALTGRLAPLRAEVVRHVEAFGGEVKAPRAPLSPSSPSPSRSASAPAASAPAGAGPSGSAPAPSGASAPAPGASRSRGSGSSASVPVDPKAALAGLAEAERALSDARITALLDLPGESARLLASVAAAGAAHAYLLTEEAR